jgi:hypothetical protein
MGICASNAATETEPPPTAENGSNNASPSSPDDEGDKQQPSPSKQKMQQQPITNDLSVPREKNAVSALLGGQIWYGIWG